MVITVKVNRHGHHRLAKCSMSPVVVWFLPLSRTLFRAVWVISPSARLFIQEFKFLCTLTTSAPFSSVTAPRYITRHPVLALTSGFTKRPQNSASGGQVLLVASWSSQTPLTFNPGSWMQRLSNLQKEVARGRGWRGGDTEKREGRREN